MQAEYILQTQALLLELVHVPTQDHRLVQFPSNYQILQMVVSQCWPQEELLIQRCNPDKSLVTLLDNKDYITAANSSSNLTLYVSPKPTPPSYQFYGQLNKVEHSHITYNTGTGPSYACHSDGCPNYQSHTLPVTNDTSHNTHVNTEKSSKDEVCSSCHQSPGGYHGNHPSRSFGGVSHLSLS